MPNPWTWQRGRNPYRWNSFTVLGLGPEAGTPEVNRARQGLERRIDFAPEKPVVAGREVTRADAVQAASRLNTFPDRVEEELLVHRSHRLAWDAPEDLVERIRPVVRLQERPSPVEPHRLLGFLPPPRARELRPVTARATEERVEEDARLALTKLLSGREWYVLFRP